MPKSNAERQAEFRERTATTTARLNTPLTLEAGAALDALAQAWGLTKRAALERLLLETIQHERP
jgi:hypothetical protein